MKNKKIDLLRKLFLVLSILIILAWLIIGIVYAVTIDETTGTSFPWYSGFGFAGLILVLPFMLSSGLYICFQIQVNKKKV